VNDERLKRVRAFLAGEIVVDTRAPVLVWECPSTRRTTCSTTIVVVPVDGEDLDLIRIDWAAMDDWFEEDEPVYVHPR